MHIPDHDTALPHLDLEEKHCQHWSFGSSRRMFTAALPMRCRCVSHNDITLLQAAAAVYC